MPWMPYGPNDPGHKFIDQWFQKGVPKVLLHEALHAVVNRQVRTPQELGAHLAMRFGADLLRFQGAQLASLANEAFRTIAARQE